MNRGAIFKENISDIKRVSYDKEHQMYMIDDTIRNSDMKVIDFDKVKTKHCNQLGTTEEILKSVDGLLFYEDKPIFIEFKNGNIANTKKCKSEIKTKMKDSLLMFCDITNEYISYGKENITFILVYQDSRYFIGQTLNRKAGEAENTLFDALKKYEKAYFKSVYTYTVKEFEEYLLKYEKQLTVKRRES